MEHVSITPRTARAIATAAALLLGLSSCGGTPPDPASLLRQAKAAVDAADSVHFKLTSTNAKGGGALITGGEGDMRRPSGFAGTLDVSISGLAVGVQIVSYNGTFYVKLPTDSIFSTANPSDYGFGDPAKLLDRDSGLSSLLVLCKSTTLADSDRYNNEELDEVTCSLPGAQVGELLTTADPSKQVSARFGISPSSHQLRRVVLNGPFFSATAMSTFTVVLDDYGENVTVTPPATR